MSRDHDAMLVHACLNGDPTAFATLVDRYQGPLYNATYRITGSVDDALDAWRRAVETWLSLGQTARARELYQRWRERFAGAETERALGRRL